MGKTSKHVFGDVLPTGTADLHAHGLPICPLYQAIVQEWDAQFQ